MKKGDFLSVRRCDNGFVFELNNYACDSRERVTAVARTDTEATQIFCRILRGESVGEVHNMEDK